MRKLLTGFVGLLILFIFHSCQKEISQEYGQPATGSLQGNGGDCLPKFVSGSYIAAKALNDSNYIDVTVDVVTPGPYTILTDTVNGFSFRATGTFANAGTTTVKLKGSGSPTSAGVSVFTVVFDSSSCEVAVTVLPAGSTGGPAVFSLDGSPGLCAANSLNGTYYKDTTLDVRHYIMVNVNVTTVGTYTVSTNTTNGYSFTGTGTFGATGPAVIKMQGTGKPLAAGTDNFTVTAGAATCTFPVTVTAVTPPASTCNPNIQGTYTAGTATTATNKVTVMHNYTAAGNYTVTVTTVNGISFASQVIPVTIPGASTITLTASGTPTAAGTNTFTVNFGDNQTCTFNITVNSSTPVVNNDYFPTTANSWWTYDFPGSTDTVKMSNDGPTITFGSNVFQRFVFRYNTVPGDTSFYRKDAATGFYYESIDTAGFGPDLVFNQPRLDLLFLKNTLATGNTWNSDFNATADGIPFPVVLRVKYNCVNANAAITVNGKNFTNVYQIRQTFEFGIMGTFSDAGVPPIDFFYAKGVGQIKIDDGTDQQNIRFWQVN